MTTVLSFDIGIKNLAFCKAAIRNNVLSIIQWNLVSLKSASAESICECLDEFTNLLDGVQFILIEKQMLRNVKMSFVAAAIEMYLYVRSSQQFQTVKFLRVPAWRRTKETSMQKCSYRQRKADSVAAATNWVRGTSWIGTIESSKKKDDLADCLCQIHCWSPFEKCV